MPAYSSTGGGVSAPPFAAAGPDHRRTPGRARGTADVQRLPAPRRALAAAGLLAGCWWLLTGGTESSWLVGAPAVLAAGWAAGRLSQAGSGPVSLAGILRFLPFFLWESILGGIDVVSRTLAPRMRIQPGLTVYTVRLQRRSAKVFFVYCVSLLPGTLAADLQGDRLDVHVLNRDSDPTQELRRLEDAIAEIYVEPT